MNQTTGIVHSRQMLLCGLDHFDVFSTEQVTYDKVRITHGPRTTDGQ